MKQRYELQRFDNETQIFRENSYSNENSQGNQFKDPNLGNKIIGENHD